MTDRIILSYLNQQKKWSDAKDIEHVVDDLNQLKGAVEVFQLTGNTLGIDAAKSMVKALCEQSKLKHLLWNDLFTGRLKTEIADALRFLSSGLMKAQVNLVELDLSDNAFGPDGVVGVTELLASPCCYTLKVLNMNNQGLGHNGCSLLVKALKSGRANSDYKGLNLEVFIAGRNRLENAGIKMLAEVFGDGMSSLKKITLLQNGIGIHGMEGVENFLKCIKDHTDLISLNITDNTIKEEGIQRICELLPTFTKLEELHVGDCFVKNKGVRYLQNALENGHCPMLHTISLNGNEIKSRIAKQFVEILVQVRPEIKRLNLQENEIKKSSMAEIKDILNEYDKGDILVEDDLTTDAYDYDDDSDYSDSETDESQNGNETSDNDLESVNSDESNGKQIAQSTFVGTSVPPASETPVLPKAFAFSFTPQKNSKPSLFDNKACPNKSAENARTALFTAQPSNNIFQSPNSKAFSFVEAAKSGKDTLINHLRSQTLLYREVFTILSDLNQISSLAVDDEVIRLAEQHPENAVRLALFMCRNPKLFDSSVKLLCHLLSSTANRWSQATNSLLVEMECIKSEEKQFVPACSDVPDVLIQALKLVIANNVLPINDNVKIILRTVIKNLNKRLSEQDADNLVSALESSLSALKL